MAVYYVRMTGNDTNNGTSPETAFRTIQKALNVVRPGDIVYVGAGNYDEMLTTNNVNATADNPVRIIGDRKGEFTGDKGEVVIGRRIRLGVQTTFSEPNIKAYGSYYIFEGFTFFGGEDGLIKNYDTISGWIFRNCVVWNREKIVFIIGGGYCREMKFENCILLSSLYLMHIIYGVASGNIIKFDNCFIKCQVIFGTDSPGNKGATVTFRNCFFLFQSNSVAGSTMTASDSIFFSAGTTNYISFYNCVGLSTASIGGSNNWKGAYVPFPVDFWRNKWLIMTDPLVRNLSDSNATSEDIYGRPPIGTRDLGPIEYDYGEPVIGKKIFIKNTLRGGFTNAI